jgi:hypothetical protein
MIRLALTTGALALAAFSFVPASVAAEVWGSVAYSPDTRSFGYSDGFDDQSEAESRALEACMEQGGPNCQTAVLFSNACGAVMAGPDGWGHAWDENGEEAAQARAYEACSENSVDCTLVVSHCSPDRSIVAD